MKKSAAVGAVLLAVLLVVLVLAGYAAQSAPEGEALSGAASESAVVLLFEPCGDTELFAYTDLDVTHVLAADGSRACTAKYPARFAFLRGDALTMLSLQRDTVFVQRVQTTTLEQTALFSLDIPGDDVLFAETDDFGRFFMVLYSEPTEVLVYDALGGYTGSLLYAEPVRGLQVIDSRLFVLLPSCGERIALDADFPQTGTDTFAYSAEAQPYRMLSADTYINTEGRVCALDGTALLDTGLNTSAAGLTVLTDDSIFWASDSSTVTRASLTGNDAADFQVNGILKALTATAAVTYRDGAFYRTPYREFAARPTPTPTASASPTSSPAPDSGLTFRDGCLFAPEGMTCAGLRNVLAPREAQIYTENMAPASGRLKTGLTALVDGTPYTVVVPGDINGSGTVNSADLRLLQRHLADDEPLDSDALFAADLNADGVADAADLVLLSARIGA